MLERSVDTRRPLGSPRRGAAWLVAPTPAAPLVLVPPAAEGAAPAPPDAPKAKAKAASLVTFKGRAGTRTNGRVTIQQRRANRRWSTIAGGRTARRGKFSLTWITPSRGARVTVRAVLAGRPSGASRIRRLRVLAPARGAKRVIVSKKTRIISPSVVRSVPDGGQPGKLTYAGGNDAQKGSIIVIGQGPETPEGFLGRVTDVDRTNSGTVVSTVPATLQQAVPEGSMNLVAAPVKAARARAAQRARISCAGSAGASIEHDVSLSAGLRLDGSWTFLGGLQSASVTANASFTASVKAAIAADGSCSLPQTTLLRIKGPGVSGFVGPVPIVLTSTLSVYLDATAEARGELSTGASAGFDASAGVSWTKGAGFSPIQTFTPRFSFDPPAISASASVAANVTPTVDVELYGLAGPRVALRTGVEFAADSAGDPWWALTVPVDLTASIAIKPLGLESPKLELYKRTFTIADAGGPVGSPPPGPPAPVTNAPDPTSNLAAGYGQSCGLRSNGTVSCWGDNGSGELGNGTTTDRNTPGPVSGLGDAAGISAGHDHSCALRVSGGVACWGQNASGQLGNGTTTGSMTPVNVSGISNATKLSAGSSHTCAVLGTRRVSCWGNGGGGRLGNGSTANSGTPGEVSGILNATAVAAGTNHTCALRSDGTVSCWGDNAEGDLGNGTTQQSSVPVPVSGITNAIGVSVGTAHSCATLATGRVVCWGAGFDGQLGHGSTTSSRVPVEVSGITDATSVSANSARPCARLSSGTLRCWGRNDYGVLGDGTTQRRLSPVQVSGISDAAAIVAGFQHTCTLRTNGAMACWGYGVDGQLGNGANATSFSQVPVTGFP